MLDALPSPAGTIRFDHLLGINYFQAFYSRNTNIFGAMPSLHVAYPVLVAFTVLGMGRRWVAGTTLFALLVAFSAVYLEHHWIWDVLFGALFGAAAFGLVHLPALIWRWRRRGVGRDRPGKAAPHQAGDEDKGSNHE